MSILLVKPQDGSNKDSEETDSLIRRRDIGRMKGRLDVPESKTLY